MKNVISIQQEYKLMFCEYPDVVDVKLMRAMLGGIGRRTAYQLLRNRAIESVKIGRTYRIPKISIISYLCNSPNKDDNSIFIPE